MSKVKRKKKDYTETTGRYAQDLSKLIFAAIILGGIMKQHDSPTTTLFIIGIAAVIVLGALGIRWTGKDKPNEEA